MKTTLKILLFLFFTIATGIFIVPRGLVHAAEIKIIGPEITTLASASQFEVTINLNSEGENLNAVSGSILFPSETLAVQAIRDGGAIVNFWIVRPTEAPFTDTLSSVRYSGTIPGGFTGEGKLFSVVFQVLAPNDSLKISGADLISLKHDGRGTQAQTSSKPLVLKTTASAETDGEPQVKQVEPLIDTTAPLFLDVSIIQDPNLYNGQWTAVFYTVDPESGIDHYEIQESQNSQPDDQPWTKTTSPYLLTDQKRLSWLHIKAINRVGLSTITSTPPSKVPTKMSPNITAKTVLIGFGIILLLALFVRLAKNRLRKKQTALPKTNVQ